MDQQLTKSPLRRDRGVGYRISFCEKQTGSRRAIKWLCYHRWWGRVDEFAPLTPRVEMGLCRWNQWQGGGCRVIGICLWT